MCILGMAKSAPEICILLKNWATISIYTFLGTFSGTFSGSFSGSLSGGTLGPLFRQFRRHGAALSCSSWGCLPEICISRNMYFPKYVFAEICVCRNMYLPKYVFTEICFPEVFPSMFRLWVKFRMFRVETGFAWRS